MYKLLYILYIPLLIIEWLADIVSKIWASIHESIRDVALVLEKLINEHEFTVQKSPKKG